MNSQKKNKQIPLDDWSRLEQYLSRNYQPVDPRAGFINDLQDNLEALGSSTRKGIEKTKNHLKSAIMLITGLAIVVLIIRFIVFLISYMKTRSFGEGHISKLGSTPVTYSQFVEN